MSEFPLMGAGIVWQDLQIGQRWRTFKRTITETDIVNFITVTGQLETLFIDATINNYMTVGKPAPAALTYSLIEGFIMQGIARGTRPALLEIRKKMLAPVAQGDTIWAEIEVLDIKASPLDHGAVVTTKIDVKNQDNVDVMTYTAVRFIAGDIKG